MANLTKQRHASILNAFVPTYARHTRDVHNYLMRRGESIPGYINADLSTFKMFPRAVIPDGDNATHTMIQAHLSGNQYVPKLDNDSTADKYLLAANLDPNSINYDVDGASLNLEGISGEMFFSSSDAAQLFHYSKSTQYMTGNYTSDMVLGAHMKGRKAYNQAILTRKLQQKPAPASRQTGGVLASNTLEQDESEHSRLSRESDSTNSLYKKGTKDHRKDRFNDVEKGSTFYSVPKKRLDDDGAPSYSTPNFTRPIVPSDPPPAYKTDYAAYIENHPNVPQPSAPTASDLHESFHIHDPYQGLNPSFYQRPATNQPGSTHPSAPIDSPHPAFDNEHAAFLERHPDLQHQSAPRDLEPAYDFRAYMERHPSILRPRASNQPPTNVANDGSPNPRRFKPTSDVKHSLERVLENARFQREIYRDSPGREERQYFEAYQDQIQRVEQELEAFHQQPEGYNVDNAPLRASPQQSALGSNHASLVRSAHHSKIDLPTDSQLAARLAAITAPLHRTPAHSAIADSALAAPVSVIHHPNLRPQPREQSPQQSPANSAIAALASVIHRPNPPPPSREQTPQQTPANSAIAAPTTFLHNPFDSLPGAQTPQNSDLLNQALLPEDDEQEEERQIDRRDDLEFNIRKHEINLEKAREDPSDSLNQLYARQAGLTLNRLLEERALHAKAHPKLYKLVDKSRQVRQALEDEEVQHLNVADHPNVAQAEIEPPAEDVPIHLGQTTAPLAELPALPGTNHVDFHQPNIQTQSALKHQREEDDDQHYLAKRSAVVISPSLQPSNIQNIPTKLQRSRIVSHSKIKSKVSGSTYFRSPKASVIGNQFVRSEGGFHFVHGRPVTPRKREASPVLPVEIPLLPTASDLHNEPPIELPPPIPAPPEIPPDAVSAQKLKAVKKSRKTQDQIAIEEGKAFAAKNATQQAAVAAEAVGKRIGSPKKGQPSTSAGPAGNLRRKNKPAEDLLPNGLTLAETKIILKAREKALFTKSEKVYEEELKFIDKVYKIGERRNKELNAGLVHFTSEDPPEASEDIDLDADEFEEPSFPIRKYLPRNAKK